MAAHKLVVQSDLPALEFPLTAGSQRIGSGRQCEICISHPEVPAHAVTVESRGNVLLVNNVSPYSLYLGDEIVESRGRCAWRIGVPLLLMRNVTMTVVPTGAVSESAADVERDATGAATSPSTSSRKAKDPASPTSARPGSGMRTAVQVVIIVLSVLSGLFMLRDCAQIGSGVHRHDRKLVEGAGYQEVGDFRRTRTAQSTPSGLDYATTSGSR